LPIRRAVVYGRATMTNSRQNFSLTGHSIAFDPRIDAVRDDLADVKLADRLFAPHYAQGTPMACVVPHSAVCEAPDGPQITELLNGEHFMVLDVSGGWSWGYCAHDHYVGYLKADALGHAQGRREETRAVDIASAAERYLDMAYVYGGRGGAGIDCSGLVQRSAAATGVAAMRDSDMQQATLGRALDAGENLSRNDLVFFPEHVGIMLDPTTLIHATRHRNGVSIEPLASVITRIAARHPEPVLARKRIEP
jgi:cell wall-associated NlpC family hydrolase